MSWQEDFLELQAKETSNIDELAEVTGLAKNSEVGFVNSKTGAGMLSREDGSLEAYSDYGLGFRFDPAHQALMVFAPNIHLFSGSVKQHKQIDDLAYFDKEYGQVMALLESDNNDQL